MALSTEEQNKYFETQGSSATPLSPAQYEATIRTPKPITSEAMAPAEAIKFPEPKVSQPSGSLDLSSFIKDAQNLYNTGNEQDKADRNTLQGMLLGELQGSRTADRAASETNLGVQAKREAAQKSATNMQMLQAEADTLEQRAQASVRGQGVTEGGLRPIMSAQQRDLNSRQRFAAAEYLATQGDLTSALQQVDQAVNDKYIDQQTNIDNLKTNLSFVQQKIDEGTIKADKVMTAALNERNRILDLQQKALEEQKEEEKGVQKVAMTLAEYGVDPNLVKGAKTVDEAISMAGTNLQAPAAKLQLQGLKLDMELTKQKIATEAKNRALLGEPTPTDRKEEAKAVATANGQIDTLQQKVDLVNAIQTSGGMSTRVGTNRLSREGVGIPLTGGKLFGVSGDSIANEILGKGQQFSGGVHKLASKEFIEALINAKSRGATFGALTEREGDALRAAATEINDWEIPDKNGKGSGYWNIDENTFNQRLNTIKELAQKSILKAKGTLLTPEEQAFINSTTQAQTSAGDYFQ